MIFSLFHALTFARTTILPRFLPPGPPTTSGAPGPHPLAKKLQAWVKGTPRLTSLICFLIWYVGNYDPAMKVVAYTEFAILIRIILGSITFRNLVAPVFYAYFLRQRYYQSVFTRNVFAQATTYLDFFVAKANNAYVSLIYGKVKALITQWVNSDVIEPNSPQGARR